MKTAKQWVEDHSQSGAFDCIGSITDAEALVSAIQEDAMRSAAEDNRNQMKAETQRQIEAAKYQVRRNLPAWPSTFGLCANECGRGKGGRGSGICLDCAMDDLAILIGKEDAEAYEAEIRELNRKERGDDEAP